jgi:electron transfer flavoprotein beta subunit
MRIIVLLRQVPDLVEELEIDGSGTALAPGVADLVTSEWDECALEEALQLRALHGGTVTCLVPDSGAIRDLLATCLARGADRAVGIGAFDGPPGSHATALAFAAALAGIPFDLVLTGVQAIDDLEGQLCPLLATRLDLPHVSVVARIEVAADGRSVVVGQEHAGGTVTEFEVDLPAALGIAASRVPPRYVAVSRVRQVLRTATFEALDVPAGDASGLIVEELAAPASTGGAEMIPGDAAAVADRIMAILAERGLTAPGPR